MTPERWKRMNEMLDLRQPDLTVCVEQVHKTHNLSAIIRTADAIGIPEVHAVWLSEDKRLKRGTASGSQNWVKTVGHATIGDAISTLKSQGMQVVATCLSETSVDYRNIDYTKPTALLMGQERYGITEEALALADQHIIIPMVGMAQSLNVSVAAAILMYEAQRQRQNAGLYEQPRMDEQEKHRILFEGGHPIFARLCREKGVDYPPLDEDGQIAAESEWWQRIQQSKK
ncbi:tRNA (guanosine(18)-2'-O)-methyltransferase TrmH [Algicola sagamiensis]|uniref:tRNA (guanosine(18)-2'-O)-methyltransferase TrmH n=1 Tax=Algicola sagamiensis TaxID=163869 RepID=UPI0003782795|nr:tRNA (guanosine(18)-2'-O)-methyltransferase TrmH [Algicola sagamiensis]